MTTYKTSASKSLAAGVGLALLIGGSSIAAAKDVTIIGEPLPDDVLTERVSYADLDLASANGVKQLSTRVRGAASNVCAPLEDVRSFFEYGACRSYALDGAEPQIALAVARAQQLAAFGTSAIAPVAIVISAPQG